LEADRTIEVRPRDWLVPVALVALGERGSYGYELLDRLAELGFGRINPGPLYRTLRRMKREGIVKTEWEMAHHGSACRRYTITGAGEAYLASWAEACGEYQKVLDAFKLAYYGRRPPNNALDLGEEAS
jgi:PadR family transcriptional regulator, regulatory protein PadR